MHTKVQSKKYARRGHLVYLRVDVGVILKTISNKGYKKVHRIRVAQKKVT